MMMRKSERAALALCVGVSVLLASCGGGGDNEDPPTPPPEIEQPVEPAPEIPAPNPEEPPPPAPEPEPNPEPGEEVPPPVDPNSAFQPAADDLPGVNKIHAYPNDRVTVEARYVSTPVSGADSYFGPDGLCGVFQSPPPATYPGGLITLPTVNLDVDKTDDCEPEILIELSIDGSAPAAAKMRLRGNTTRYADQKSYRIKYQSKEQSWDGNGEQTLQFNKHPWDLSRVRNKLAFDLMSLVPHHPSLSTQFAEILYRDGSGLQQNLGLFTHVEKMDANYLKRRNLKAGSNIYKAENFTFERDDDLVLDDQGEPGPRFEQVLEIESDAGDHRVILALTEKLNADILESGTAAGQAYFAELFEQHFNRNNYLAWFSSLILLGNYDSHEKNWALYQPLDSEKFYFLPWDYDDSLGFANQPEADPDSKLDWDLGVANWWGLPLHRHFLRQPGNVALLEKAVNEIRQKYLTDQAVRAFLERYRPAVEPLATRLPDLEFLPVSGDKALLWRQEFERLPRVIGDNHQKFLDSLNKPMPFWIYPYKSDNQLVVDWTWPAPFHPRGEAIRHTIEIARLVPGKAPFAADTLVVPRTIVSGGEFEVPGNLTPAQYLIRVMAIDQDNDETPAFNSHPSAVEGQASLPGTMCFDLRTWLACS